jgi:uncharacterized protein (TIGR02646 family)
MIRVLHGEAPEGLTKEAERRLAKLRLEWDRLDAADLAAVSTFLTRHDQDLKAGYRKAWDALRKQWRRRCAYCSAELHALDQIDHFRPRHPQRGQHGGYWWLTWSWANLLPACSTCNSAKANRFPVEGERLQPWQHDTTNERATLIDPSQEDPQAHLEFVPEQVNGRKRWTIQGKDARGKSTAAELGLDKDDDRFATHLERLRDLLQDLEQARARGPQPLRALWRRKTKVLLTVAEDEPDAPAQPFPGLSQAFLRHHYSEAMEQFGLELPTVGDLQPTPPPAPPYPERPQLSELTEALQLEIRSLGGKPRTAQTHAVLLQLVALRSWTLEELTELLPQSPATLKSHLRALAKTGALTFDGALAQA